MARKKVTLAFIANDTKRKASYQKRKTGLLNKVKEINTLYDVHVCAIIYGPGHVEPEVWPSKEGVHDVLNRFNEVPDIERTPRMMNPETFTQRQTTKQHHKYLSLHKENMENMVERLVYQSWAAKTPNYLDQFDMRCKGEVVWTTNRMLWDLESRMDALKVKSGDPSAASVPVPGPAVDPPVNVSFSI